jgi:Flp pilus assembly protein TadB
VSRERARRRAEREAARAVAEAKRLRTARRRAALKRLRPQWNRRRTAWGLGRRSPGQRAAVTGVAVGLLLAVWYFVEPLAGRIALTLLVLLALPVFAVITFDRKGMKL